jgi:glycosyltransferase involved in cell wall biosynthesis
LLADLVFHLAEKGNTVKVITSRQRYDDAAAALLSHECERDVEIVRVWSTRFGRGRMVGRAFDYFSFYLSVLWTSMLWARAGDVFISKTDPPVVGVLAALVGLTRRIHRVNWLQDVFPEVAQAAGMRIAAGLVGRIVASARDWSLRGATNVVLGERMRALLQARGASSLVVLPNWADGRVIHPLPAARNSLRTEWDLAGRFVVGYSGNLGRVHDSSAIIEAAISLRHDPSVVFLFIGGGKESEALRKAVSQLGLSNVVFRPYQQREALAVSLTLPNVHLVSLRPEFEGMVVPSKLYGVMAAGRPCIFIGDDAGEVALLLREGNCGITVPSTDGVALARVIITLRDDPARCAAMGEAARRMFEARFDMPVALACWDQLLAEVVSGVGSNGKINMGAKNQRDGFFQ